MSSTTQEPTQVFIKLYLSKEHIRRFSIPNSSTFEEIKAKIINFYEELGQTTEQDLELQYCDDDNEWTILRSEDDWYCCKAICPSTIKIRRPDMWMKAILSYKTHQQAVVRTIKKEKKELIAKGQQLCSQVNQELKKLGSSEEVQKIEKAVEDLCTQMIDSITPLLHSATNATTEFITSVENTLVRQPSSTTTASNENVNSPLIRLTEEDEQVVDEEEEKLFENQQTENVIERSGFIWVNNTTQPSTEQVQQKVEEPTPVVEEIPQVEPVHVEEPTPVQETQVVEPVHVEPSPFAEHLNMLSVMGFTDVEKNIELLKKHNGNVPFVVDALLSL